LGDFDAVYPCEDIDAVWAEYRYSSHIEVVEYPKFEELPKIGL
jgi:hypothetical protein